ncbi:MAG: ribbon-helix-helix domain-containing protein [Desulfobacterales bacterium]|nr:ribbon-helix-helix domain-containing protein [Desulfobacterales bacterium]MDX2512442.1 ribbon-helix-helix domain-containing protein [Desulfobacterales bacterium]
MNTETIRMNITLPKDLVASLDEMAGPRKRSRFIVQALRMMIDQLKKAEMDAQLTEGYRAGKSENLKVAETFEPFDLEGWDEY